MYSIGVGLVSAGVPNFCWASTKKGLSVYGKLSVHML